MALSFAGLDEILGLKYGDVLRGGWGPRMRDRFGYRTPDDYYEAAIWDLVDAGTHWLDVGCGRSIFGSNAAAARVLADRCARLTGLDPSDNIHDNPYVHARAQCLLEEFDAPAAFDLITLRMVAEHITDPVAAVAALSRLCRDGGHVVIYTVDKWSPVSLVSAVTPMAVHHWGKALLWRGEERDTFPTAYLMNTRATLAAQMAQGGFVEAGFRRLSDTRTTNRFFLPNLLELSLWRGLAAVGLGYPEACLLGVYRRSARQAA